METLVWIVHVLAALGIIGLVLLQHGKGADVGAAFGSGASGSLFGATGAANALSRATKFLVIVFFLTSMGLTYFSVSRHHQAAAVPVPQQAPAGEAPAGGKVQDIPN